MSEPSRRARDIGNAVVRRTTGLVAATCLVGTGAFVAIQARTHSADSSGGGTPAAGPQPTDPLLVTAGSSTAPADSGACVDDHDADHDEHDHESGDNDEHGSDDHETDHEEHESNGDHASHDHDSNDGGRAGCASAFTPPAAAPAAAPPQTTPRVVSGGS
jgi:hypothetical protein